MILLHIELDVVFGIFTPNGFRMRLQWAECDRNTMFPIHLKKTPK